MISVLVILALSVSTIVEGGVYTRYGKYECPSGAELVYSGVLAGTHYEVTGGASDFLCLPRYNVQYARYRHNTRDGKLVPGEYHFPLSSSSRSDHNPPCAVCKTRRPNVLMIPGRTSCYAGWTTEYWGYIMTEAEANKHSSRYICIDHHFDALYNSARDTKPATDLFHVKVECSSGLIPCSTSQYNSYKQVTCAVCTRH